MSYTAVESLVEELIGEVLSSEISLKNKKVLIQSLYNFQDKFDTSKTYLRHQESFNKLGIDPSLRDLVVNDYWEWSSLVFNLLDKRKNYKLIQEFRYGLLNIAYDLDLDLSEFSNLNKIKKNKFILEIRHILESNINNLKTKPKYFQKLSLKELEESISIKSEEKFFYNLFLNFKKNLEDIINEISQIEEQKKVNFDTLSALPKLVELNLGFEFIKKKDKTFYFQINCRPGSEEFINISAQFVIEYFEETCLIPKVQIVFKEINSWSRFNKPEKNFHLETAINLLLESQNLIKNKLINSWGGWKFSANDDFKKLEKCILDIKNNLNGVYNYLGFYESNSLESLSKKYPLKKAMNLADTFEQNGSVTYDLTRPESFFEVDFLIFKKLFLMLYISLSINRGENPKDEKELLKSEIDKMHDKSSSKGMYREVLDKSHLEPQILFFRM